MIWDVLGHIDSCHVTCALEGINVNRYETLWQISSPRNVTYSLEFIRLSWHPNPKLPRLISGSDVLTDVLTRCGSIYI